MIAINTAIEEGIIFESNKLNPISVIPKLLGEKNNIVDIRPTNVHALIKYIICVFGMG
jgi:hypothetical protein